MRRLPNAISALRLVLAFCFPFVGTAWRLPVVVLSALTDWLDGLLARRWRVQSSSGALLDVIADKAFAVSVLFTLLLAGDIRWWHVALVVPRDLIVALASLIIAVRRRWVVFTEMPARMSGRVATVLLFTWFLTLVTPALEVLRLPVFALTSVASCIAAVEYVVRLGRALAKPAP